MGKIHLAAQQKTVLDAALGYIESGCSILPVQGKKPTLIAWNHTKMRYPWTILQARRAEKNMVQAWHNRGWLAGIGVICGAVSGNLVVIDLDGDEAVKEFMDTWPALFWNNYRVLSGSGHGMHVYIRVENLPPSVRTKGFELRADGCYVVAPPSRHPVTNNQYRPAPDNTTVQTIADLNDLVEWIQLKNHTVRREREQTAIKPAIGGYGAAALAAECQKIRSTGEGSRNNQLNTSAFRLGQLVGGGYLEAGSVENQLFDVALSIGLPEREALRTITSGLNAGQQSPRTAK